MINLTCKHIAHRAYKKYPLCSMWKTEEQPLNLKVEFVLKPAILHRYLLTWIQYCSPLSPLFNFSHLPVTSIIAAKANVITRWSWIHGKENKIKAITVLGKRMLPDSTTTHKILIEILKVVSREIMNEAMKNFFIILTHLDDGSLNSKIKIGSAPLNGNANANGTILSWSPSYQSQHRRSQWRYRSRLCIRYQWR